MSRLKSDNYKRKLDGEFKMADDAEDADQAIFSRYLCIRIAGYVEVCVKEIISNFISNKSHRIATQYIQNAITNLTNLNNGKIEKVLASFSEDWKDYYVDNVEESMKTSLGSIYTLRNDIAHGGSAQINLSDLKLHYVNIQSAIKLIEKTVTR